MNKISINQNGPRDLWNISESVLNNANECYVKAFHNLANKQRIGNLVDSFIYITDALKIKMKSLLEQFTGETHDARHIPTLFRKLSAFSDRLYWPDILSAMGILKKYGIFDDELYQAQLPFLDLDIKDYPTLAGAVYEIRGLTLQIYKFQWRKEHPQSALAS
jgi:hypothetical protein